MDDGPALARPRAGARWRSASVALAASLLVAGRAVAHELEPPAPASPLVAPMPAARAGNVSDVLVPLVVEVDAEGTVRAAAVEASVDDALDAAALALVQGTRFRPARRDGVGVPATFRAAVRFVARSHGAAAAPPHPPAHVHGGGAPHVHAGGASAAPAQAAPTEATVHASRAPRAASEAERDAAVLGALPHRTAADALRAVPGVFVAQHGGEGKAAQIFLRGFDADHGQDVEVRVGGLPVNEVSNLHGQGYADLNFVPAEAIRRVTVLPGPFDPRQGDFAVAGSVSFDLGLAEPGVVARGSAGSFGTRRLFTGYRPERADAGTFVAFEHFTTSGFGPSRAADRTSGLAQATFDVGDHVELRVLAGLYAADFASAGVLPQRALEAGAWDRFATLDPRQGGASHRAFALAELHRQDGRDRWSFAPWVSVKGMSLRQNFTGSFLARTARGAVADVVDGADRNELADERGAVGLRAEYGRRLAAVADAEAVVGLDGRFERVTQRQRTLDATDAARRVDVDARVRATEVGSYGELRLRPWPALAVRAGGRADVLAFGAEEVSTLGAERAATGAIGSARTSAELRLGRGAALVGSFGEGFRSPQARALARGETVRPTRVRGGELGLRLAEGPLRASLAAFASWLSEDVVFDPVTARNAPAPGTRRAGLAADVGVRLGRRVTLASSATVVDARFRAGAGDFAAGDPLPYVPRVVVRSDAVYRAPFARAFGRTLEGTLGLGVTGVASRPLPYGEPGANVALADARASVRLREIELGVDVQNLLDAPWIEGQFVYPSSFGDARAVSSLPVSHVSVGPPRLVLATLTLHFGDPAP